MLVLLATCALVAACTALYLYLRHSLAYWRRLKVPFVAPSMPFGNFKAAVLGTKNMADLMADIYREHREERYIGTYFMATPMLQLHDPEIIRQVFIKEFQDFSGRGVHSDPDNDPLSGHLFNQSGQKWRNMRVKLSPTFTTGKIKYMFSTISECADFLRDHISSSMQHHGGVYEEDIRELLARFSTDIISSVAFGIESNSMKNPDSEFRRMGQRFFDPCLNVSLRTLLSFFGRSYMKAFNIRSVSSDVHNFFTRIVVELVAYREQNNVERADMLNLLIKLKNEGFVPPDSAKDAAEDKTNGYLNGVNGHDDARQTLSAKEIAAQVFVFFIAGFETTSTTGSFALYELAKNAHIQEKVIKEVTAVLKKHNGKLTYEAIMDMPYTDMVIQETMRHYPPVPFLTREAMVRRKLPLTDVTLDKGMRLVIPVRALHMDPQYWDEPKTFNPLRFTEEAKKSRPPMVYLPFGDGPMICIGMRLGLVQVKMALATILSRASVSLAPGLPREPELLTRMLVPTPVHGIKLVLNDRV